MSDASTPASFDDGVVAAAEPRRRRTGPAVVGVAAAVVLVVAAGAAFATWRLVGGGGAQPADALPADTLGVVSIDLDPSGGQKLQALRVLRSFPTLREEVGLEDDADIVGRVFESLQEDEDLCPDVDYAEDVEPWIGQRFAVAAVPGKGDAGPEPVFVAQVDDPDAARDGVDALKACAAEEGASDEGGVAIGDDYLVVARTEAVAQGVLDGGADEPLSGDAGYREWTGRAGDDAIVTMYAAKGAADALAQADGLGQAELAQLQTQLESFEGAAATLRFDDGGIVLSGAVGAGDQSFTGGSVADQVGALPADTAAVAAFGSSEESRAEIRKRLDELEPGATDDLVGEIEGGFASVGLQFPDDLLTVLGSTISVSVGGDAPASLDDPADVPAGVLVDGDPEAVQDVITRAEQGLGASLSQQGIVTESDDDSIALSLQPDYAETLLESGALGEDDVFAEVVPELDDAQGLLFVRFDSAWRDLLLQDVDEADRGDLEAVQALGISGWSDDGATRFEARLALD